MDKWVALGIAMGIVILIHMILEFYILRYYILGAAALFFLYRIYVEVRKLLKR